MIGVKERFPAKVLTDWRRILSVDNGLKICVAMNWGFIRRLEEFAPRFGSKFTLHRFIAGEGTTSQFCERVS